MASILAQNARLVQQGAEQIRDAFRRQHPALIDKWNTVFTDFQPVTHTQTNMGDLIARLEKKELDVESDQAKAHARAVAVLGPKRGRWK